MPNVSRTHDCDLHYKRKTYEKPFTCYGCKMPGFGFRYVCNLCGDELHRECRYPRRKITHECFVSSDFAFRETPFTRQGKDNRKEPSKVCNACGKDIRGFSYHCKADNLDLHPCCRKLHDKIAIGDTKFNRSSRVPSKCSWCRQRKVTDAGHGWSFESSCEKYRLHVYCMTEMVHEVSSLEKVDMGRLVKPKKTSTPGSTVSRTIKLFLKIVLGALLGDPTVLISNVLVELVAGGLK